MALITYIVPVYNLQKEEVRKCIDSIVNQTYHDNEIIIVDDGSTNGIELFCDELAAKYDLIVIHQKNQGLAAARNTGIKKAKGEWIVHVDGDDWVDTELSKCLVEAAKTCSVDIFVWGFIIATGERQQKLFLKNKQAFEGDFNSIKEDVICSILGGNDRFSSLSLNTSWAKAYRREFLIKNDIFFDIRLRRAQDVACNLYAFDAAKSVAYIDRALNYYRNDNESLSRSYNPKNIGYVIATANAVKEFMDNHSLTPKTQRAYCLFIQRCFRMINEMTIQNSKNPNSYSDKKQLFHTIIHQEPFAAVFSSGYKRTGLIWAILDTLYHHHCYTGIHVYNKILKLLYRIKHITK